MTAHGKGGKGGKDDQAPKEFTYVAPDDESDEDVDFDDVTDDSDVGDDEGVEAVADENVEAQASDEAEASGDVEATVEADVSDAEAVETAEDAEVTDVVGDADELAEAATLDGSADDLAAVAHEAMGDEGLKPGLQIPLEGRQEELPLVETMTAAEAAAAGGESISVADLPVLVPDTADLPPHELRAVVEALLYVATRPLTVKKLQECLPGTSADYLDGFLAGLAQRFDHENRGWELRRLAGGWQLLTRRSLYPWVRQLDRKELPTKLSKSALETLAIVAYKQPITRGEVEDIRGVQCGPVLRQLMDMKLVLVTGRSETLLGRPLLYATTDQFLTRFGLGSIDDLPKKHEFGN